MCQFAASSVKGIKPATGKYGTDAGLSTDSKQHLKGAMVCYTYFLDSAHTVV